VLYTSHCLTFRLLLCSRKNNELERQGQKVEGEGYWGRAGREARKSRWRAEETCWEELVGIQVTEGFRGYKQI